MSSNLVIVAIPAEDDYVWKLSSEKVPHLTLLFLGEADTNADQAQRISEFLEHAIAVSNMGPFYLDVDYRGTLGVDDADVLYFDKGWDSEEITQLRGWLLQNNDIKTLHDAAPQFEGWVPHLTMGYPDTPANEDNRDRPGIHCVCFDRIALWFGDYEGPEYRLKREYSKADLAVAWSQLGETAVAELLHYGKKGMKWGVRKEDKPTETKKSRWDPEGHDLSTDIAKSAVGSLVPITAPFAIPANVRLYRGAFRGANAKLVDVQEKKFTKDAQSAKNFVEINNRASDRINRDIQAINKKYPDTLTPKTQKKYNDEVVKSMQDAYRESANSIGNKNRTMHLDLEFRNDGMDFVIKAQEGAPKPVPRRVVHADDTGDSFEVRGKIKRAPTGHIIGFEFDTDDSMAQSVEYDYEACVLLGADFLEHYGVKGMKWGVQKSRFQSKLHERRVNAEIATRAKRPARDVKAYPTIGSSKRKKATVPTKGGEDHPPTEDAVKVATAAQKLKKSGVAALTNQELQDMQRRLNLENDVQRLMTGNKTAGQKFVDGLLGRGSKDDRRAFENQAGQSTRRAVAPVVKRAAAVGVRKALVKV